MINPAKEPFNNEGTTGMGRGNADFFDSIGISRDEQSRMTQRALLPMAGINEPVAWNNDVARSLSDMKANRRSNAQMRRVGKKKS
ncbi:MAG: hypothetical protein EBY26_00240 [Microbacteriaceae bacterium]|nr:hypothetical protein [Microbacteriaceae bacterium]